MVFCFRTRIFVINFITLFCLVAIKSDDNYLYLLLKVHQYNDHMADRLVRLKIYLLLINPHEEVNKC